MNAHAGLLFVWICAGLSVIAIVAGLLTALFASKRFRARVQAVRAAVPALDLERARSDVTRLSAAAAEAPVLLNDARASLERINQALSDLRLPEAMLALRTAGAAMRLLVSLR